METKNFGQPINKIGLVSKSFLSLAIGCLFAWLAGHDVVWSDVWVVFSTVDFRIAAVYAAIITGAHVVRTYRWGLLLEPLDHVPFGRLFAVSTVGNLVLLVLPLRLGEFARPLLIADRNKIRVSAALGTIVVERIVDSLFMALLLVGSLLFLGKEHRVSWEFKSGVWILAAGLTACLGVLLWILWKRAVASRWVQRIARIFSLRLADRLSSFLNAFIDGFLVFPNVRLLLLFLGLTAFIWWMNAAGLLYLLQAFPGLQGLGWSAAWTVLSLICIGLMIPAGPVMVGNFHFFVKLALSLFVADAILGTSGVAYAILLHAIQVMVQLLLGVVWLFSKHISFHRLLRSGLRAEQDLPLRQGICEG